MRLPDELTVSTHALYIPPPAPTPSGSFRTPAGKLDGPEDHRLAGLRELHEEIGAKPGEFIYLGKLLSSPGFSSEVIHMYLARGLTFTGQELDEDEFLDVVRQPFSTLVERVMAGEITDAKTVACVLKGAEFLRRERGQ